MPRILSLKETETPEAIQACVRLFSGGGVVAYPTETFYGLGADAADERAVERIFSIKGRDFRNPIPLIIGSHDDLKALVSDTPDRAARLMQIFWPGPLTLVFSATSHVNPVLTGGTGKIGIRLSSHPVASALARGMGGAITATSANLSGEGECNSAVEVMRQIGERIDLILDGGATAGKPGSTIVDVTVDPPSILREGAIAADLIMYYAGMGRI